MLLKLVVLGEPKSQQRHRSFKMGDKISTYDPSKKDKKDFLSVLMDNAPDVPFSGTLKIEIIFYFTRLKTHYGTGRNQNVLKDNAPLHKNTAPDIDNLLKFCMDALNHIYWQNDSLISEIKARKLYDDKPRTEIYIQSL